MGVLLYVRESLENNLGNFGYFQKVIAFVGAMVQANLEIRSEQNVGEIQYGFVGICFGFHCTTLKANQAATICYAYSE